MSALRNAFLLIAALSSASAAGCAVVSHNGRTKAGVATLPAFVQADMTQGALNRTGRPLDFAIQGRGFFMVRTGAENHSGIAFTRNGHFFVNARHEVVLAVGDDGCRLLPPITIPANVSEIWVGQEGSISYVPPGTSDHRRIGHVHLAQFCNPAALTRDQNSGLFLANDRSGLPVLSEPGERGAGTIEQGFLEASDVNLSRERLHLPERIAK